jgi:tRNA(Ile)-lysidine synthase
MINIQGNIPRTVYIACSGGVDSMAITDFLKRSHNVTLLYFHHGTIHGEESLKFLRDYSRDHGLRLIYKIIDNPTPPKGMSIEDYWRQCRYAFFSEYTDAPIITCHHLDDCVETWIWSSMHGMGKLIPYRNNNVIRPFRTTRKSEFVKWCERNNVSWVQDPSNNDTKYIRNHIRSMMPQLLVINPGIHTVVKKKIINEGEVYE